jgi:hypothetical protein
MGRYPQCSASRRDWFGSSALACGARFHQAWGDVFLAASNLAASRAKRCAEFSIGRRMSGLLIAFARSPS